MRVRALKFRMHGKGALPCASVLFLCAGCDRSPSINILGSFFPIWLLCAAVGAVLAFLTHVTLQRLKWSEQLAPALVVYPALAVLFSLSIWLAFYS